MKNISRKLTRLGAGVALVGGLMYVATPTLANGPLLGQLECPAEPVKIVVLGDSLADGLWGSFYRAFTECRGVDVMRKTTISDGLTRTDPEEWLDRIGPEGALADLFVVQIGANDIQNLREGTSRAVFGSPEWDSAYLARAQTLAEGLVEGGGQVVWMGLPIVGQERFEDSYRAITALQAEAAERPGIRFVDTHEPTTFGLGEFVMSAVIDGSVRLLRNTDQVHFTVIGYDVVAGLLYSDVEKLFHQAGRAAAIDALTLQ